MTDDELRAKSSWVARAVTIAANLVRREYSQADAEAVDRQGRDALALKRAVEDGQDIITALEAEKKRLEERVAELEEKYEQQHALKAALCRSVKAAQESAPLRAHRNRALPQGPPEEKE